MTDVAVAADGTVERSATIDRTAQPSSLLLRGAAGFTPRARKRTLTHRAEMAFGLHDEVKWDQASDTLIIRESQDLSPIFDRNAELRNEGISGDGYSDTRELRRVASIPLVVVNQWYREGFNIFDEKNAAELKRRLNDSENLFMRTSIGQV